MKSCLSCKIELKKYQKKYCSNKCQKDYEYEAYIANWLAGSLSGSRGIETKNYSRHVMRYLREKYGEKCQLCDWNEVHPSTGRCPLELDHIDGDAENNNIHNLRLLCPNCHSLTPTYKNLNFGKGRLWRKEKYVRIV